MKRTHTGNHSGRKVPPFSISSEKHLLGSILREPVLIESIRSMVTGGDDFFRTDHGNLFEALIKAHGHHQSSCTQDLIDALSRLGLLDDAGGRELVLRLVSETDERESAVS